MIDLTSAEEVESSRPNINSIVAVRITSAIKKKSKANHPMLETTGEIVGPEIIPAKLEDGTVFETSDHLTQKVMSWVMFGGEEDKLKFIYSNLKKFLKHFDFDLSNIEFESLDVGKIVNKALSVKVSTKLESQKDAAGAVLIHPVTGKPLPPMDQYNMGEIYGRVPEMDGVTMA